MFGITATQQGVPVDLASDYQKVLDSRWKFLETEVEDRITRSITNSTGSDEFFPLLTHNLGYLPMYEVINKPLTSFFDLAVFISDENRIYVRVRSGETLSVDVLITVYSLEVGEEYAAPSIPPGLATSNENSVYGVRSLDTTVPLAQMGDSEAYKYTLNTRAKALSVHMHGSRVVDGSTDNEMEITHNLGYPPTNFIMRMYPPEHFSGNNQFLDTEWTISDTGIIYSRTRADNVSVTISGAQALISGIFAFVILKDPIEVIG